MTGDAFQIKPINFNHCSRFLLNLSSEEKKDPIKLCSYIELAHWYYLDLVRPEDHRLPACTLKEFMGTRE